MTPIAFSARQNTKSVAMKIMANLSMCSLASNNPSSFEKYFFCSLSIMPQSPVTQIDCQI